MEKVTATKVVPTPQHANTHTHRDIQKLLKSPNK